MTANRRHAATALTPCSDELWVVGCQVDTFVDRTQRNRAADRRQLLLISADGSVADGGYPWAPGLDGGFTVLELPSREQASTRAARIAKACRGDRVLRVFGLDPPS